MGRQEGRGFDSSFEILINFKLILENKWISCHAKEEYGGSQ